MSESQMIVRRKLGQWAVLAGIDLGVPQSIGWQYHSGKVRPVVALYIAFGTLILFNLLAGLLFRKQSRSSEVNSSKSILVGGVVMAIFSALVTFQSIALIHPRNDFLDLANSNKPLEEIQPIRTRLIVELIRHTAANSREENISLKEVKEHPIEPPLYSPASFSNREIMSSTAAQLKKYSAIDLDYFQKQLAARTDFRRKMGLLDPDYLALWDKERSEQEAIDRDTNNLELAFLESVYTLYGYASEHADDIHVKEEEISIANPEVRKAFNNKMSASKDLNKRLQSAVQSQTKRQQELRSQMPGS
jgi:hypothetical protein